MDGYEVARRLQNRPDLKDVKLIAVTGYGQEADRLQSQEAGFDHHLVKPVQNIGRDAHGFWVSTNSLSEAYVFEMHVSRA